MLRLEFPNISHKQQWEEVMTEWNEKESQKNPWALFRGNTFEEFLELAINDLNDHNIHGVPATLIFLIDDSKRILWATQIRHHIDHPNLMEMWWHIGYGIRPSERRRWYAKEMPRLALIEARKLWLDTVLITCSDDNIGSYKTIEANGWVFERFAEKDWVKKRRYWIDVFRKEKELLISLELELLSFECRHNPERIDALLCDDFFECGKHGDRFWKTECLASLPKESDEKKFEVSEIEVHMLSENLWQARYLCTIENPWQSSTTSFRSSLWRKWESWWQMLYHQGTLIQE